MEVYTQPFLLELQSYCPGQGVYLRWLSSLGNWEGWLFEGNIDFTTEPEAGSVFRESGSPAKVLRRQVRKSNCCARGTYCPANGTA